MRCHYLSDLHLETQGFPWSLPRGDCLIIAGDLCHAACLDPDRRDKYHLDQRDRVLRFLDDARAHFAHILLVAGNHEHYDGVFDDTVARLQCGLPGVTVLDNGAVEVGGVVFFGATLWSDFEGRSQVAMNAVRRRMGEYFFVKMRDRDWPGSVPVRKFRPEDAADAFDAAWSALRGSVAASADKPIVVVTHHAPSRRGLNPLHKGNGLDSAYASDLDREIEALGSIRYWVHGHTHIRRTYHIGGTTIVANCRGFGGRDPSAHRFTPASYFEV